MLFPKKMVHRVTEISPQYLQEQGIHGLILDIDNTLTTHDNPIPSDGVARWLDTMRENDIQMIVLSNNHGPRVEPFAKILGLDYLAEGKKPLPSGFRRCAAALNMKREELCIIGDQIFTDVLGARCCGLTAVLVTAINNHNFWLKLRHVAELPFIYLARNRRITK
ncbi:MAG: YqeG family HAD IIIA-type phosphatase [Oscillospiraceae bacterium]|nr:YqeG family HAD IIIA-type phosphatase [Oscillospiraceae bacterium]